MNSPVTKLEVRDGKIVALEAGGERIEPSEVISSLPLRATVGLSGAAATGAVQAAAQGLRYRDFLTISLIIDGEDLFPDNWIYIHEPGVQVGRIQNFRSWSPWMVPDQSKASIGMEYFCFKGDELWESSDEDLVELAKREIEQLGLAKAANVERGFVTRVPKAYPMYDADYSERVAVDQGAGWRASPTSSRSAATACTATTTPTTRCSPPCARSRTSWPVRSMTCGRSTPSRPTTRSIRSRSSPTSGFRAPQYEREPLHADARRPPRNGHMSDWPVSGCDAILILTLTEGVRTGLHPHGGGSGRIRSRRPRHRRGRFSLTRRTACAWGQMRRHRRPRRLGLRAPGAHRRGARRRLRRT